MKYLIAFVSIIELIACAPIKEGEATSSNFLRVDGRFLKTPCGEKVILRGVNEMFVWSNDHTGKRTLPEIAQTGANTVRLVWSTQGSVQELDQLITNCIALQMIPIPELHDATGKIEKVPTLVDFWTRVDVVEVLKKHEAYMILNVANEPGLFDTSDTVFLNIYKDAIRRIRQTGIQSPLMIDATNWGQDINMLQRNWQILQRHDSLRNVLFAVHTWWPKDSSTIDPGSTQRVLTEIAKSVEIGMPLVVSEFAPMGPGCTQYFDYETLIKVCHENEIGWLSWSWGVVNNSDCADMDMTNGGVFGQWTETPNNGIWGEVVALSSTYSIKNTATKTSYIQNRTTCQ